jgi:hypothetical protein
MQGSTSSIVLVLVLIVGPKLFIEPGSKAFSRLSSGSGPGLSITSLQAHRQVTNSRPLQKKMN